MKVDERPRVSGSLTLVFLAGWLIHGSCASAQETSNAVPDDSTTESTASLQETDAAIEITIRSGDTFQSISKREYNSVGLWRLIAEYNGLEVNSTLYDGQVLRLPKLKALAPEFARIAYAHGDNQIISMADQAAGARVLNGDDNLYLNDIIETGPNGFATIIFRTGTVVNLQPNTRVQLIKLNCLLADEVCFIELAAERGSISTEVKHLEKQKNDFRITTPTSSAAVRGTTLDVATADSLMLVGVTDGEVAVATEEQSAAVPAGFGIAARPTGLDDLVELLPSPAFTGIPPRLAAQDLIACWQQPSAESYQWTLSEDVEKAQIRQQESTQDPFFTLGDHVAGEYYLTVRAVDGIGLKGFLTTEKIFINAIDPTVTPVELNAEREDQTLLVSVVDTREQAGGYEIQMASTERFEDAVSIDVSTAGEVIFSANEEPVFLRARALIGPKLVSAFGPVLALD